MSARQQCVAVVHRADDIRMVMRKIIEHEGFEYSEFDTVNEAVTQIPQHAMTIVDEREMSKISDDDSVKEAFRKAVNAGLVKIATYRDDIRKGGWLISLTSDNGIGLRRSLRNIACKEA